MRGHYTGPRRPPPPPFHKTGSHVPTDPTATAILPFPVLPADTTLLDVLAFGWFLAAWFGYTLVQDHLPTRRFGINGHLDIVRRHWMRRMLERDNRIVDSQFVGHTMHSATFFASTTMLVLAGLVGSFGAVDQAYAVIRNLSFTVKTSRDLFELKLLLLVAIFAFAFFKFTWALRQFNYCIALIGSAPNAPVEEAEAVELSNVLAGTLTLAIKALNGGLRAFYFAIAALGWMVHPFALIAASAGIVAILARRQLFSDAERLIGGHTAMIQRRTGGAKDADGSADG